MTATAHTLICICICACICTHTRAAEWRIPDPHAPCVSDADCYLGAACVGGGVMTTTCAPAACAHLAVRNGTCVDDVCTVDVITGQCTPF